MDFRLPISDCRSAALEMRRTSSPASPPIGTRHSAIASAFTLVEILIILAIISLVVALGVPLFGVLTGSKSQEAGQNVVAAAIGQARTIALNEGKYAGLFFYVDPATERTAMSLVIVEDPTTGLEDPDPYDKYKAWVDGETYRTPKVLAGGAQQVGDRVIGLASDSSATFRAEGSAKNVYTPDAGNLYYSRYAEYFGNMRPTVHVYRARQDTTATDTNRPPRNGPINSGAVEYRRISNTALPKASAGTSPTLTGSGSFADSTLGPFTNVNWGPNDYAQVTPYSASGERQLLPQGVGVQLIISPTLRAGETTGNPERYVRTGLIMFDPQGRLTTDDGALAQAGALGEALGLQADVASLPAAVGVVFYDRAAFRADPTRTEADWIQQNVPASGSTQINASSKNPALNDNLSTTRENELGTPANPNCEESWLDANATPLLINRFSGALSEAQ